MRAVRSRDAGADVDVEELPDAGFCGQEANRVAEERAVGPDVPDNRRVGGDNSLGCLPVRLCPLRSR
jgi:hypothetical protein